MSPGELRGAARVNTLLRYYELTLRMAETMPEAGIYDDLIMDHIRNARNYRVLDDADLAATGSNPLCGDDMQVFMKLSGEHIAEIAFQCTCCGISMASASMMTQIVAGKRIEDVRRLLREMIALVDGADALVPLATPERLAMRDTVRRFPARTRCAALPWQTLESALSAGAATRPA